MNSDNDSSPATELDAHLRDASTLWDDGHLGEALTLLREQAESYPDDPALLCMLGEAARTVGAEGSAYEYFRRCLAAGPTDPVLLATAGSGLAAFDDPEAESALRLAALTAPDLPLARLHYGAYLAHEGLLDSAIPELEAARSLDADDATIRFELAVAYLLAGRREEGTAEMEEALALAPDNSWIRSLYGLSLFETDQSEEAAVELHRAAEERPDDVEIQLIAALSSASQGWMDQAWNALARAETRGLADGALLEDVEQGIEAGPEAAAALLSAELAPSVLRARLLERL